MEIIKKYIQYWNKLLIIHYKNYPKYDQTGSLEVKVLCVMKPYWILWKI